MEFGFTFDANEVEPDERQAGDYQPIRSGTRLHMQCIEAELIPTRNDGQGIKLTHQVISGEYENRKVWDFINVSLPSSPKAEAIGRSQLAALCKAMGRPQVSSTEDLLYAPFEATVGVKAGDVIQGTNPPERYPAKNTIKTYHAQGEQPAAPRQQAPAQRQASAPAKPTGAKPWQRNNAAA